ncbi:ABC transporter permease subunit [Amycolatopsis sp. cg5]|uniref:ABC transporter permease subunit n=1 Tax=Amycolatopsis sp. cg5 TaxID=3238802 RepID=UPI00352480C7
MGNLIKAEFRKTLTLNTWWVLLIPLVITAFGFSWVWGRITNDFVDFIGRSDAALIASAIGVQPDALPVGLLSMAHGVNIAGIIPALFGVFALAGEYRSKTITTTFLTAPNRISALSAKMITYVVWGALYGVVAFGVSALGTLLTVDSTRMPSGPQWFAALGATVLSFVLVTLFGIGVGAVLNKVTLAVVLLLVWFLVLEFGVVLATWNWTTVLGTILPNGAANGIVGGVASEAFKINSLDFGTEDGRWGQYFLQLTAGSPGVVSWWVSALIFAGWTAVFFGFGWASNQKRDIT